MRRSREAENEDYCHDQTLVVRRTATEPYPCLDIVPFENGIYIQKLSYQDVPPRMIFITRMVDKRHHEHGDGSLVHM